MAYGVMAEELLMECSWEGINHAEDKPKELQTRPGRKG